MTDTNIASQAPGWRYTEKPPKIERRFAFASYTETSAFLERLAELSKQDNYFPDLSFGRTHAHVTIFARDEKAIGAADLAFAQRAGVLVEPDAAPT